MKARGGINVLLALNGAKTKLSKERDDLKMLYCKSSVVFTHYKKNNSKTIAFILYRDREHR